MPGLINYQAIVLAGGDDKRMHPLTSSSLKALMPVANKPLLSYSLQSLAAAGVRSAFIVAMGDQPAADIQSWIKEQDVAGTLKLQCEVIKAPKDCHGTADALRAVGSKVTARTLLVVSGDLLTDYPVNAIVAKHQLDGALATVLLFKRKVSPTTETKPGKPPKNVDYIGLDASHERLMFYTPSPESLKEIKVPLHGVRAHGSMHISTDLVDAHLYVFDRSVLNLLEKNPNLSSVRQDLLPYLTTQQAMHGMGMAMPGSDAQQASQAGQPPAQRQESTTGNQGEGEDNSQAEATGGQYMEFSHSRQHDATLQPATPHLEAGALHVHIVQPPVYCARIGDADSYLEVSRDLADPRVGLHLTGLKASTQYDNVVPATTTIGSKTTIASACILGENCVLGDKCSIKRSVFGNNCKLGSNVKVLNSVLQDNVVIADGVTIQNSVVCAGAVIKERAALKDCQIGAGFTVAGGRDYNSDVLGGKPALSA